MLVVGLNLIDIDNSHLISSKADGRRRTPATLRCTGSIVSDLECGIC